MSIDRGFEKDCILYRSRSLLIPCSPLSSVALFSDPDLLLVVPHCHGVRHARRFFVSEKLHAVVTLTYTRHILYLVRLLFSRIGYWRKSQL